MRNISAVAARPTRKPWLLRSPFFAGTSKEGCSYQDQLIVSRDEFEGHCFNNLDYLLRSRYEWMNRWIEDSDLVVEIGAGAGFSRRYLKRPAILTDIVGNAWLDLAMDGTALAFRDASIDVIIVSNALHHFAHPAKFFAEAIRVLKEGGLILINDAYSSLLCRMALRLFRHEGYSYDVDVFDPASVANDPLDPGSGNNAVSNLLFDSPKDFTARFPELEILSDAPRETLLFVLSGGVTAKVGVPELPNRLLDWVAALDRLLVASAPRLFALCRRTVIRKTVPSCS